MFKYQQNPILVAMLQKSIISLLVVLLAAPLNTSAAAWMAISMVNSDQHVQHVNSASLSHGEHMPAAHVVDSADDALSATTHEHDASDCEAHCASCSNHCSSLGIVSSSQKYIEPKCFPAAIPSDETKIRLDVPFRPPIFS